MNDLKKVGIRLKDWVLFMGNNRSFKGTKEMEQREQIKQNELIKKDSPRYVDLTSIVFYTVRDLRMKTLLKTL